LKTQEVNDGKDKLRSAQYQDELEKKKVYMAVRQLESSFNPEATTICRT
jgi:hypothetical protein